MRYPAVDRERSRGNARNRTESGSDNRDRCLRHPVYREYHASSGRATGRRGYRGGKTNRGPVGGVVSRRSYCGHLRTNIQCDFVESFGASGTEIQSHRIEVKSCNCPGDRCALLHSGAVEDGINDRVGAKHALDETDARFGIGPGILSGSAESADDEGAPAAVTQKHRVRASGAEFQTRETAAVAIFHREGQRYHSVRGSVSLGQRRTGHGQVGGNHTGTIAAQTGAAGIGQVARIRSRLSRW